MRSRTWKSHWKKETNCQQGRSRMRTFHIVTSFVLGFRVWWCKLLVFVTLNAQLSDHAFSDFTKSFNRLSNKPVWALTEAQVQDVEAQQVERHEDDLVNWAQNLDWSKYIQTSLFIFSFKFVLRVIFLTLNSKFELFQVKMKLIGVDVNKY